MRISPLTVLSSPLRVEPLPYLRYDAVERFAIIARKYGKDVKTKKPCSLSAK
jgi:hypothetical protein